MVDIVLNIGDQSGGGVVCYYDLNLACPQL